LAIPDFAEFTLGLRKPTSSPRFPHTAVIARFKRAIQYAAAYPSAFHAAARNYWIARFRGQ
jgi:hypothetical protein